MPQRVALWLTSSLQPRLKLFDDPPLNTNTKVHVTLVSALVHQPRDVEVLVEKLKKLSAALKYKNVTVQPPIGTDPVPTLDSDRSRIYLPLAASIELENLHEISAQLIQPEEHWEPKLILAQGAGVTSLLERLKEDPSSLKLEFTIDSIEVTVSGCCNKCHNTVHVGVNPMGTEWFFRSANYVNGEWVEASGGERLPVLDPSTGKEFHSVPVAGSEEVDKAVVAAKNAFEGWSALKASARANYLISIADVVERRKAELAALETMDSGKPLREAEADVADVIECFRYYAKLALSINPPDQDGSPIKLGSNHESSFGSVVRYEPIGVCALIASFNYPMLIATWKVAPCLAAGSTCVLKPSEHTSLTALELAAIAMEVGLPQGVLNVITGPGSSTGSMLTEHPKIDKIAFTGSVATGSHIMKVSSKKITKTTLELGGKSPLIICRDSAPIDKILDWLLLGIFFNAGQVCSATSRILVHKDIYPKLLERMAAEAKKITLGNGLDPDSLMGPLVSEAQQRRVMDYITHGKAEGAKLITGGATDPKAFGGGFFVEPTIFADVKPWMKIWKEEIFGPVLCITPFETEADAIALANDSNFGLAGSVFSQDPETCRRIARSLRCGIVWINCSQPTFVQAPWGGYRQSGVGRELGPWGLHNYLQIKQITSWKDPSSSNWGWYQQSKL